MHATQGRAQVQEQVRVQSQVQLHAAPFCITSARNARISADDVFGYIKDERQGYTFSVRLGGLLTVDTCPELYGWDVRVGAPKRFQVLFPQNKFVITTG